MTKSISTFSCLIVLSMCAIGLFISCKTTTITEPVATLTTPIKNYSFPGEWLGDYAGELIIHSAGMDTTRVDMSLSIQQPDATGLYPWIIGYGKDDLRYYGLEAINAAKGHYRVDELNSIKLDGYLRGNHFISKFQVMKSDLLVDYEKRPDGILVRFYVSSATDYKTTGGEALGSDTIPSVRTYPIAVYQEALLKPVNK